MMTAAARTVGASLLGVTLLTGSASAECAWVLWITVTDQRAAARPADIVATYLNAAECIGAIDHNERVYRAPSTVITRDARTMLHVDFRGKDGTFRSSFSYLCAPDTVDPRAPKAK